MKRILVIVVIAVLCFCDSAMVFAVEAGVGSGETGEQSKTEAELSNSGTSSTDTSTEKQDKTEAELSNSGTSGTDTLTEKQDKAGAELLNSGTPDTNMPTNQLMFLTMAENTDYRWNVNDSGGINSEVHLDDVSGENCNFRFDYVENGYYGIKHIKSGGTDRFVDVDGKSTKEGAVLHVFENKDDELGGSSNYHRHFKFYYQRTDSNGNKIYKIQIRKSELWVGYEDTDKNGGPSYGDKLIQTNEANGAEWIITKEVVPKSGKEAEDLVASGDAAAFCEIFEAGTIESLNRVDDDISNGTRIHTYTLGTSSRWLIE